VCCLSLCVRPCTITHTHSYKLAARAHTNVRAHARRCTRTQAHSRFLYFSLSFAVYLSHRQEKELAAALRAHGDVLGDDQTKLLHTESQAHEEKHALSHRIQELDAHLASSNMQLANADKAYKGAQAQVRLLQSKVGMLQHDLSHERRLAQKEAQAVHDRQRAEWQTREEELKRALKEAQAQRQAAQAEVDAVRESLKESQEAVDSTRGVLQQQSEDHAKVVKALHLHLLQSHEREKESREAAAALTVTTQELEGALNALRLDYAHLVSPSAWHISH